MNNLIIPNDVTADKSYYKQTFWHRHIEEAEYKNPTLKKDSSVSTPLVKVIDITKMFDLTHFVDSVKEELQELAKSRTKYANWRRKKLRQHLKKTEICIAYFRMDYENKHPFDNRKKIKINDWFCTVYVDDAVQAGNLCGHQYFIKQLRKDKQHSIDGYRSYVKKSLDTSLNEFLTDLDVLMNIMVKFAPKNKILPN